MNYQCTCVFEAAASRGVKVFGLCGCPVCRENFGLRNTLVYIIYNGQVKLPPMR